MVEYRNARVLAAHARGIVNPASGLAPNVLRVLLTLRISQNGPAVLPKRISQSHGESSVIGVSKPKGLPLISPDGNRGVEHNGRA